MRCTILAIGSRGDVHPLIALGVGLQAAGYRVRIASHADFEADVCTRGMDFFALTGNAARFFSGPAAVVLRDRTRSPAGFVGFFDNYLGAFLEQLLVGCWEASQDADVVLCWSFLMGIGPALAERLQVPVLLVASYPVDFPTAVFANPFHGDLRPGEQHADGPAENLTTWRQYSETARVGHAIRQRWRVETLGLAPLAWEAEFEQIQQMPHLFGYSPLVLPKPADWPEWAHVTGYWLLDAPVDYTPSPALDAFLAAHPYPVALGFSSQVGRDAQRTTQIIAAALAQIGQPGILIAGFGGLKGVDLPPTILPLRSVPYDWLFAHAAAMVHQGGAGSTGMALRAGIPNMAVVFGYDQLLWGRRIAALGAGADPILAEELTADNLAAAVQRLVEDGAVRQAAAAVGAALRQEDGVGAAVQVVEKILR